MYKCVVVSIFWNPQTLSRRSKEENDALLLKNLGRMVFTNFPLLLIQNDLPDGSHAIVSAIDISQVDGIKGREPKDPATT